MCIINTKIFTIYEHMAVLDENIYFNQNSRIYEIYEVYGLWEASQLAMTCSKLTLETLAQDVKYVQS